MTSFTRRFALKMLGLGTAWLGHGRLAIGQTTSDQDADNGQGQSTTVSWSNTHDRVWLSEEIWANPMEDWAVVDGAAECQTGGGDRNLQLITHQLSDPSGTLNMSVEIRRVEGPGEDNGVGFRVGIQSDLNEYRSNCFASRGINAGIIDGNLVLGRKQSPLKLDPSETIKLTLHGKPDGAQYQLTLRAIDSKGDRAGEVSQKVATEAVLGNLALVSNFAAQPNNRKGMRYRFNNWSVGGNAIAVKPEQKFGPILWSMYSLSDSRSDEGFVMKISALTGPLGDEDNHEVELLIQDNDEWKSLGHATLDPDAWTATFRIPTGMKRGNFRIDSSIGSGVATGAKPRRTGAARSKRILRADSLRIGALTCQNDYGFPYAPVAENLIRLDPDMLYFSGDQIYESHGGYGLIRQPAVPAILNYLRKYYMFGWAFREAMRDRPTLCIPDDHDVFQGNIWGEGGAPMQVDVGGASSNGGYIEPARMVNVVHKTNAAHHPDYYDPTPVQAGHQRLLR